MNYHQHWPFQRNEICCESRNRHEIEYWKRIVFQIESFAFLLLQIQLDDLTQVSVVNDVHLSCSQPSCLVTLISLWERKTLEHKLCMSIEIQLKCYPKSGSQQNVNRCLDLLTERSRKGVKEWGWKYGERKKNRDNLPQIYTVLMNCFAESKENQLVRMVALSNDNFNIKIY